MKKMHVLLMGILLLSTGCGEDAKRGAVTGKVTLDGEPITNGSISFVPIEGTQSPSSGAVIGAGKYEIPRANGPMAGSFKIVIIAQRKTGRMVLAGSPAPPGTMVEDTEEAIPKRYNVESELRRDIVAGNNSLDFELTSK